MKRQAFQPGEIRDNNDNIIREGAYGYSMDAGLKYLTVI